MCLRVLLAWLALLLGGCATVLPVPAPHDQESAGLMIEVKVRVSNLATYRADAVYFVKNCVEGVGGQCDERLIASSYAKEGRVYLLNVPPGEYRAVATSFMSGVWGDNGLYFAYFPSALAKDSTIRVGPRQLAYLGAFLLSASYGVCSDTAEASQIKYAELIEPGTPKCGWLKTTMHKLGSGDYVFIGGKAYVAGKVTFHYQGGAYEKQNVLPGALGWRSLVRNDLNGSGWEGWMFFGD